VVINNKNHTASDHSRVTIRGILDRGAARKE